MLTIKYIKLYLLIWEMPLYMTRIVVKHREGYVMKTKSSGKLCYVDCSVFIFRAQKSKQSHSSTSTTP